MKLEYIDEFNNILDSVENTSLVPSVGHMIYIQNEIFFVESVIWYAGENLIKVNLTLEKQKPKITESKNYGVKLDQLIAIQTTANKALKETSTLKKQIFSIREYLKTQQGKNENR